MMKRQEKWIGPKEWRTTPPLAKRDYPKEKPGLKVVTLLKWGGLAVAVMVLVWLVGGQ